MPQPSRIDVSVVIPNLDGGDILLDAVKSVPRTGTEIVIVDNGSVDGSADGAEQLGSHIRIIRRARNEGYAKACNLGAAATGGPFLLFLNSDAILDAGAVEMLLSHAETDIQAALWRPLILLPSGELEFAGERYMRTGKWWRLRNPPSTEPYPVFVAMGACLLVRRDAFNAVGGFNASYFAYYEEADLCWRLRLAGWEVRVVPAARVVHTSGATARRVLSPDQIRYLLCRNRMRTTIANAGAVSLITTFPTLFATRVASVIRHLVSRRLRAATSIAAAVLWPFVHIRTMWAERRAAQRLRTVPDRRLFRPEIVEPLTRSRLREVLRDQTKL